MHQLNNITIIPDKIPTNIASMIIPNLESFAIFNNIMQYYTTFMKERFIILFYNKFTTRRCRVGFIQYYWEKK